MRSRSSNRSTVHYLTAGALIAAVYAAVTLLCSLAGLSSGVIQVRLSEALCVLVLFTPAAVPGLWIGCVIANLFTGAVWDVVFGSLATLLGAAGGRLLARLSEAADRAGKTRRAAVCRCLVPLPTVAANVLIVPFVLKYAYGYGDAVWLMMVTVGLGEIVSAYVCGLLLMWALCRRGGRFLKS